MYCYNIWTLSKTEEGLTRLININSSNKYYIWRKVYDIVKDYEWEKEDVPYIYESAKTEVEFPFKYRECHFSKKLRTFLNNI